MLGLGGLGLKGVGFSGFWLGAQYIHTWRPKSFPTVRSRISGWNYNGGYPKQNRRST